MKQLTIATRKSALALAQARAWLRELERRYPDLTTAELLVTTTGDRIVDRPLHEIGGKGLFVKEIEQALLERRADIAVHSMKDLPPGLAATLSIGCVPRRADPRDVLVSQSGATLQELPAGSRVGTSSLRRQVQLRALRADLVFVPLRGNVDTRLRKCAAGEMDAIVLAHAGLLRLGLSARITQTLSPEECLPAVGQGALAIEQRDADVAVRALLEPLNDAETLLCTSAERGVMSAIHGNCQTPVAAFALRSGTELWLRAMLAEPDGSRLRYAESRAAFPSDVTAATAQGLELGHGLK